MCGEWLCSELPQTTMVVRVTYCHTDGHWHASVQLASTLTDGEQRAHLFRSRDFEPWENLLSVARWCDQATEDPMNSMAEANCVE